LTTRPRSLLTETKDLLREAGLHARKGLGQHFLVDGSQLRQILLAAELGPADSVIEVGPGLGTLTRSLADDSGRVVAVEKDEHLATLLRDIVKPFGNVTIINRDILEVDLPAIIREYLPALGPPAYKVVANLPYYITSPVLRFFLEAAVKPQVMVVMVQKAVARQITAKPGDMSLLSVAIQLYGEPRIVRYVPARSFYPAPAVDSAILKIAVFPKPRVDVETGSFFTLARAGFSAARKQIANSLAHALDRSKDDVLALLRGAGIDPRRRAETLSIEEWGRLWQEYVRLGMAA
jgi:16S rRNA (adenine1518-N6/adenine1519-N6)-dimethyltransferase